MESSVDTGRGDVREDESSGGRSSPRCLEHGWQPVNCNDIGAGREQRRRHLAGAAAQLEHTVAGPNIEERDEGSSQAMAAAGTGEDHRVDRVVGRRDPEPTHMDRRDARQPQAVRPRGLKTESTIAITRSNSAAAEWRSGDVERRSAMPCTVESPATSASDASVPV